MHCGSCATLYTYQSRKQHLMETIRKRCLLECHKRTQKHTHCKIVIKNMNESQGLAQSFNFDACAEQMRGREYKCIYVYIYLLNTIGQKVVSKMLSFVRQQ